MPGKLLCIGKNYALHADEMNSTVPTEPVVFLKPSTAIIHHGGTVVLPPMSSDVHHELELVVRIGRKGHNIDVSTALNYVDGYALGLDMTARDLQSKAKKKGHPWSVAKGFDTFAPVGDFVNPQTIVDVQNITLTLSVNGVLRQRAFTGDMVFSVSQLIAYCSKVFTLEPGDYLFTGTPEGVGPVKPGDKLECSGEGLLPLTVTVTEP